MGIKEGGGVSNFRDNKKRKTCHGESTKGRRGSEFNIGGSMSMKSPKYDRRGGEESTNCGTIASFQGLTKKTRTEIIG